MLEAYWGEFLTTPMPLELSLNSCSNRCVYCFANLNKANEITDPARVLRLLAESEKRETLTAALIRERYPVVVSNHMDPFSASNGPQVIPILRVMAEMGLPVMIQTKGGEGWQEAAEFLPPSTWYVSLSMLDDAIRAKVEPRAPSVQERLDMMRGLTERGHTVIWGYNPVVPEWSEDPEALFVAATEAGAQAVWCELMHFNYRQVHNMSPREIDALGPERIAVSQKRRADPDDWDYLMLVDALAEAYALPRFSVGLPMPTAFHAVMRGPYAKTFPVMQDWVNWCYDNLADGALVTFADFWRVMQASGTLPEGARKAAHYLGATAHNLWWTHQIPNDLTYEDLCKIIWADKRTAQCPAKFMCFAYAKRGGEPVLDDEGLPVMVFDTCWFDTMDTEVE